MHMWLLTPSHHNPQRRQKVLAAVAVISEELIVLGHMLSPGTTALYSLAGIVKEEAEVCIYAQGKHKLACMMCIHYSSLRRAA